MNRNLSWAAFALMFFVGMGRSQEIPEINIPKTVPAASAKVGKVIAFNVDKYFYIVGDSVNPATESRVIRVFGKNVNEHRAYLTFSDKDAGKPPSYHEINKDIYIFYPESYLPTIEKMLEMKGKVLCQIRFYEAGHIWASVESPLLTRIE